MIANANRFKRRAGPRVGLVSTFFLAAALVALVVVYLGAMVASAVSVGVLGEALISGAGGIVQGILLLAGIAVMGLLTFILAKGLFRNHGVDRSEFIELTAETEPELFEFLREITGHVGSKMPHRVFACPDVNAGVFFDVSFWNVFVPTRKNLLIGLGMVEALNRTELKAVLAHEFGHFGQFSMRLSHYVQVISAVIDGVIYDHDKVDRMVLRWQEAWHRGLLVGPLYLLLSRLVRSTGVVVKRGLQRLDAKVSRAMELQADAVAVELTGSDALIHALLRTDWAERCHSQTLYDLEQAAKQGLQSDDLYVHQRHLSEAMRERLGDPSLGLPPTPEEGESMLPRVFDVPRGAAAFQGWEDTHPPHFVREEYARRNYRRSEFDERSAWSLFEHPVRLRETLTGRLYENRWGLRGLVVAARKVQSYLDGEHQEIVLDPKEQAVYGHRFMEPGDLESARQEAKGSALSDGELGQWLLTLEGPMLDEAARRIVRHLSPQAVRGAMAKGLRAQAGEVSAEESTSGESATSPEEDRAWLANYDRDLMIARLAKAYRESDAEGAGLYGRYEFHLHLQNFIRWMRAHSGQFGPVMEAVQDEKVDAETLQQVFEVLAALHQGYAAGLRGGPLVPGLHGIEAGARLEALVLDEALLSAEPLMEGRLDGAWLQGFIDAWQEGMERLQHLRLKSLGALVHRSHPE